MQKYSEKTPTLALDFLIDFGSRIPAIPVGEEARAETAPFPNTFTNGAPRESLALVKMKMKINSWR